MPAKPEPSKWRRRLGLTRDARLTLRTRIAINLAIALLPLCLAAEIAQYSIAVHNRSLRESAVIARGEAVLAAQSSALQDLNTLLETVSLFSVRDSLEGIACEEAFRRVVSRHTEILALRVLSLEGRTLCRGRGLLVEDAPTPEPGWVEQASKANKFSVWAWRDISASEDEASADTIVVAAIPVRDSNQQTTAVVAAVVSFRALALATQNIELPEASAMAILDAQGKVLAQRTRGAPVGQWLPHSLSADAGPNLMSGTFVQEGLDGVRRTYVITALPGNMFGLYAQSPEEPSTAARALLYFVIAFPLLVWITASLVAGRLSERIVIDPLNRVRQAIRRYISGEDTARVEDDPSGPEEVRALGNKFNTMAETIQARDEALRAALEHQKALVREVNHRVRNNLQVMNSLLNLQSRRAKTPEQTAIFLDIQRRLNALGTVHSALYKGDDFRAVDLSVLLKDLCQSTERHLSTEWGRPVLTMRCPTPIFALPDAALTLAFLVTELIAAATSSLSPEGHPAAQLDFDLSERPEGGAILTLKVDQPVLGTLMQSRPDEGHINLFRGLIRQLRAQMEVDEHNCLVTVTMPVLV